MYLEILVTEGGSLPPSFPIVCYHTLSIALQSLTNKSSLSTLQSVILRWLSFILVVFP